MWELLKTVLKLNNDSSLEHIPHCTFWSCIAPNQAVSISMVKIVKSMVSVVYYIGFPYVPFREKRTVSDVLVLSSTVSE